MRIFNEDSIDFAINECLRNPAYQVVIAAHSLEKLYTISNSLTEVLSNRYCVERLRRSALNPCVAVFKNRSLIRVIKASESARRYRCDLLIIDPNIPYDIVVNVLKPIELVGLYDGRIRF